MQGACHPTPVVVPAQISSGTAFTVQPRLPPPLHGSNTITGGVPGVGSTYSNNYVIPGRVNDVSCGVSDGNISRLSNVLTANNGEDVISATFDLMTSGVFDDVTAGISDGIAAIISDNMVAGNSRKLITEISDEITADIYNEMTKVIFLEGNRSSTGKTNTSASCAKNTSSEIIKLEEASQILEITLKESFAQLLSAIRHSAEPFLTLLQQGQIIGPRSNFASLSSEFTRFTLKQCHQDRERSGGSPVMLQAAFNIDMMVKVVELVAGTSLSCSIAWLSVRRDMCKRHFDEGLDAIERLLVDTERHHNLNGINHPKISQVSTLIRRHLNESPEDCDVKMLIIIRKNRPLLAQGLLCAIRDISGVCACIVPASPISGNSDYVSTHNCYIIEECHPVTVTLLPSATQIIEYEYSNQSRWPVFCTRHGKRYLGMKTGIIDWDDVLSSSSLAEKETTGINLECLSGIKECHESQEPLVFIVSESLTQMKSLLEVLESRQNIQLIDRDYVGVQNRAKRNNPQRFVQFEDIAVDHRMCIVLQDITALNAKDPLERLVSKLAALQGKFQSCWVLLHKARHVDDDSEGREGNVDCISKLEGTLSLIETKMVDYRLKVVHCRTDKILAEVVREIGVRSRVDLHTTEDWTNVDWITRDPSEDEIWLLINFPCLNSFCALMLLKYFGSREGLMRSSGEELARDCPLISERVRSAFLEIRAAHASNASEYCNTENTCLAGSTKDGNYGTGFHRKQSGDTKTGPDMIVECEELVQVVKISNPKKREAYNKSQCHKTLSSRVSDEVQSLSRREHGDSKASRGEESYAPPETTLEEYSQSQSVTYINSEPLNDELMKQKTDMQCSDSVDSSGQPTDGYCNSEVSDECDSEMMIMKTTETDIQVERESDPHLDNEFLLSILEKDHAQLLFKSNPDLLIADSERKFGMCGSKACLRGNNKPYFDRMQTETVELRDLQNGFNIENRIEKKSECSIGRAVARVPSHLTATSNSYSKTYLSSSGVNDTSQSQISSADTFTTSYTACVAEQDRPLHKDYHSSIQSCSAKPVLVPFQSTQPHAVRILERISSKVACVTPNVRVPIRPLTLGTGTGNSTSQAELSNMIVKSHPVTLVKRQPGRSTGRFTAADIGSVRHVETLAHFPKPAKASRVQPTPARPSIFYESRKRASSKLNLNPVGSYHVVPEGSDDGDFIDGAGHRGEVGLNVCENADKAIVQSSAMMKGPCKRSRLTFERDCMLKGGQTRLKFV